MSASDASGRGIYLGAAFAFVFDKEGRFLLLREQPDGRKYMYDLPGGTLLKGEEPLHGLHREVHEETGLAIELASPLSYLKWDWHESGLPILVAFYVARIAGQCSVETSTEHVGYRWVSPDQYRDENLTVSLDNEHVDMLLRLYESLP